MEARTPLSWQITGRSHSPVPLGAASAIFLETDSYLLALVTKAPMVYPAIVVLRAMKALDRVFA
jgi:hypothetical protein